MPWKRENGNIVIGESGNPVFVYPDGNEIEYDADQQVVKIRELTDKASKRKQALDAATEVLGVIKEAGVDIEDRDAINDFFKNAKKNADTVKNFNDSDYVKADEVQKIKDEEAKRYRDQISTQEANFKKQLTAKDEELAKKEAAIKKSVLKTVFATSKFLKERTAFPTPEIAYDHLNHHFTVEEVNGEAVAFGLDRDGNKIYSLKSPTDYAQAHEALEIIINNHPQRDSLLLAEGSGTGADGNPKKKTLSNVKTIPKGDRMAFGQNIEKIAKGEVTVQQ